MPELHNVLITARLKPENQKKLTEALAPANVIFCHPEDREAIQRCIHRVDAAILDTDADDLILSGERLRWIHCCHAGLDKTARPEVFRRCIILTGSSGRSAPALAEHAMMFLLALTYDLPMLMRAKGEHRWAGGGEYAERTGLRGKTVGLIGLGRTGREVARLAKQFNMRVVAWRRRPDCPGNVDQVYAADLGDTIRPVLEQSDYVVLCASLNDQTYHLLNEETLRAMKPSAYLVNIGRGSLVDEAALIRALKEGVLAGAGLDTFETEPLPPDSPLWELPNVILTPHTTPKLPDREERALYYVLKNIEAYRCGTGFVNRLTPRDVYSPGHQKDPANEGGR